MVTVSIFALRDVIRKVQTEFLTPFNSKAHTTPSADADIKILCDYLEEQKIQTLFPARKDNDRAVEARDLMATGAEYANKPSAFRNFRYTKMPAVNHGLPEGLHEAVRPAAEDPGEDNEDLDEDDGAHDMGYNGQESMLSQEDIELDDEEYPAGTNLDTFIEMAHEIGDELLSYEVCSNAFTFTTCPDNPQQ